MDEGTGLELFDGGPLHLDGTATLAPGASSGFIASTAWRDWRVNSGEPLDPVGAGYDLDGDPLTLTVAVPAAHGTATADGNALTVGYQSVADHLGTDGFTYRLDDGAARSDFQLDIRVTPVLTCTVSADCTGTDLCVQAICRPASSVTLRAGGCGCSTSGSEVVVPWALLLILAGAWRRRGGSAGARGAR